MNKQLIGMTFAMATELSALIVGAYFLAGWISKTYELDANLVIAGLIVLAISGWIGHVIIIFNRYAEDSEDIPPHSN